MNCYKAHLDDSFFKGFSELLIGLREIVASE